MKKIALFLVLITFLVGCNNDNPDTYSYKILPVESYTVPASFTLGKTYEIKVKYQKPTSCTFFQGIYYSKDLNKRIVAIQAAAKDNEECSQMLPPLSEVSFNFIVSNTGSYIFKFYKGKDAQGVDLFEDVEIPVID